MIFSNFPFPALSALCSGVKRLIGRVRANALFWVGQDYGDERARAHKPCFIIRICKDRASMVPGGSDESYKCSGG